MKSENANRRSKSSSSWVSRLQEKGRSAILLNITLQRDITQKGDTPDEELMDCSGILCIASCCRL